MNKKYIIVLLFVWQHLLCFAQKTEENVLQEVVISGETSKLKVGNVSNVEKINLTNNVETGGLSLAQKLTATAGVSNLSTGEGIGKPVIRGLSGNRVAVFSQGVRVENQQWGGEHGLGLDENGYEQVEIVKGAASLLYGSDAMGGVLYFTDEKFAENDTFNARLNSEWNSNTNGWRNTAALKGSKNRWHLNAFGGLTTHKDYTDGAGDRVSNSRFRTGDFKTALGYTDERFSSIFRYGFLQEQFGLVEDGIDPQSPDNRHLQLPYQNLTTHLFSNETTAFFENSSKLKLTLGYLVNHRQEFEDNDDEAALDMTLGTFSYDVKWYSPKWRDRWALIVGTQGMHQTNRNAGEEMLIPDGTTTDFGVFALSDFYHTEKSYWQIGIRADNRHINGAEAEDFSPIKKNYPAFNFSTGVYQQLSKKFSARANISSGYRAPNMFELLSNGIHEGTNRYERGDTNLKTENNYQMDISLNYNDEHLELFVNPYANYIRRYIYLKPTGETQDDAPVYNYVQDDATLYGGEAGFHFHPHPYDWLHIEGSYAGVFGNDADKNALSLIPSQKINATVRANFSTKKALKQYSFYVQGQYSFAQNRVAEYETPTPDYYLFNTGAAFEFRFVNISAAVNNIFDKKYFDHLSRYKDEGIYNMGRNVVVRVSLHF
ncbi:MAG: TonB-dependent receptor [Prevotellaceae bacterium]|jgi:iron complex outermembrane receptor protein|nr:TonB-dependent receptor [Prevotellaceae bacterium]